MGAGSNRMNIYTVGAATQGLSNYLLQEFSDLEQIKVVIGHDCRNNSRKFAEISADIFSANGIKTIVFAYTPVFYTIAANSIAHTTTHKRNTSYFIFIIIF